MILENKFKKKIVMKILFREIWILDTLVKIRGNFGKKYNFCKYIFRKF